MGPHMNDHHVIEKYFMPEMPYCLRQGYGEDLAAAGIEDNSVDAVIMTLVLCSVNDQIKCIKEIQRVLKPGGKFFYMEHIIADEGNKLRFVQTAFMQGGFWPCLFDGCCTDRDTPRQCCGSEFYLPTRILEGGGGLGKILGTGSRIQLVIDWILMTDLRVQEETGGWSKLEQTKYDHPGSTEGGSMGLIYSCLGQIVKPHVMGVATK